MKPLNDREEDGMQIALDSVSIGAIFAARRISAHVENGAKLPELGPLLLILKVSRKLCTLTHSVQNAPFFSLGDKKRMVEIRLGVTKRELINLITIEPI